MIELARAPRRMVSLVPSLTESLFALGLGDRVVGVTDWCVHPADGVAGLPKVGGTKNVNLAKLRRLAPTHVLVNVDENRLDTVAALREFVPEIIVTHPCAPEDNLALIEQLRAAFGDVPGVDDRAVALREEIARELAATLPAGREAIPVLYLIWREPWMTVARDTYLSRMLARIHWLTLPDMFGGETGAARYPALCGDEPWLPGVQRVLLSSEPYRFDASHFAAAQALCPQAEVQLVDGELLSWYGPRAAAAVRYLADLVRLSGPVRG